MPYDDDINTKNVEDALEESRNKSQVVTQDLDQTKLPQDHHTPASPAKRPDLGSLAEDSEVKDAAPDSSEVYERGQEGIDHRPTSPDVTTNDQSKVKFKRGEKI